MVFDRHVLAFHDADFAQAFAERSHIARIGGPVSDKPDHRHRRLLRPRRKRPSSYTAAKKADEFPPPHGAYPKAKDHGRSIAGWSASVARIAIKSGASALRALGLRQKRWKRRLNSCVRRRAGPGKDTE